MRTLGTEGDIGFVGREDLGEPAPPAPPPPGKPTTGSMTGFIFLLCMAAAALGYDTETWDHDVRVPCEDLNFEELTPEQQQAAATLGWTPRTWNALE